jgi:group I intron endonuclease
MGDCDSIIGMICGIYKITNLKTGKFYIGSSNDIDQRWNEHRSRLTRKLHPNKKFVNAWHKHGKDLFLFEVLEEVSENLLLKVEQTYLDTLRPFDRHVGYNLYPFAGGGNIFQFLSDKDKKIFKEKSIRIGKDNGMYGQKHSDEAKGKQKEMAKGRFSLTWFIERNGEEVGTQKYNDRCLFFNNRKINYSFPNVFKGKKRDFMTTEIKNKISDSKTTVKKFRTHIENDIKERTLTLKEIGKKYLLSHCTIHSIKKKMHKKDASVEASFFV